MASRSLSVAVFSCLDPKSGRYVTGGLAGAVNPDDVVFYWLQTGSPRLERWDGRGRRAEGSQGNRVRGRRGRHTGRVPWFLCTSRQGVSSRNPGAGLCIGVSRSQTSDGSRVLGQSRCGCGLSAAGAMFWVLDQAALRNETSRTGWVRNGQVTPKNRLRINQNISDMVTSELSCERVCKRWLACREN